ncbi:hypothetical protein [Streptomyces sp. UG1]|uniref:hypothetical protein n=1 Tax=Streptomyces sp. UG1 TaxID=3417652 RepID=UPI003CEBAFE3
MALLKGLLAGGAVRQPQQSSFRIGDDGVHPCLGHALQQRAHGRIVPPVGQDPAVPAHPGTSPSSTIIT